VNRARALFAIVFLAALLAGAVGHARANSVYSSVRSVARASPSTANEPIRS
jgi:hypothetical protein